MNKTKIRKAARFVLDLMEIYLPSILFIVIFACFIIQVAFRYIFNFPQMWTQEISQYFYIWIVFLGACFAARDEENISFTIAYDAVGPKLKLVFDIISKLIVIVAFIYITPATIDCLKFYATRRTPILKISLLASYGAFGVFMIIYTCRSACKLVKSIRMLFKMETKNEGGDIIG